LDSLHFLAIGLYLALIAISVAFLHLKYYQKWRRHELARRTIGIATVLGFAAILALFNVIDRLSVAVIIVGFGVAGAVTGFFHTQAAAEQEQEVEYIKGDIRGGRKAGRQDTGTV
jgi:amino acid transporter